MKQVAANSLDLKTWGLLVDKFDSAFGSGPDDPTSIGLNGDLWIMIPCDNRDMKLMWEATGMRKEGEENGYKLIDQDDELIVQFRAFKMKPGILQKPIWVLDVQFHMMGIGRQVVAGFFSARSIPDFAKIIDDFFVGDARPIKTADDALRHL